DDWFTGFDPPRTFDGSRTPPADQLLSGIGEGNRCAPVGQKIDLDASPAVVELPDVPGRNLAVLGAQPGPAVRVLATAAAGLLAGYAPHSVEIVLAVLVEEAADAAERLRDRLLDHDVRVVKRTDI